jgi:paraquat-inducible protein A
MATDIAVCETCGLVQQVEKLEPGARAECCRCTSIIGSRKINSLGRTAAFSLAALILYIPANIYPILRMILLRRVFGKYRLGRLCESLQGWQWFVAGIVFLASIVIPFLKLLGLFFLVIRSARGRQQRTWIYKIIAVIGPWAMLDVFLLSILVALVKLQQIATVLPGRGLLAFTGVVLLTILASASFDPKLIWEETEQA